MSGIVGVDKLVKSGLMTYPVGHIIQVQSVSFSFTTQTSAFTAGSKAITLASPSNHVIVHYQQQIVNDGGTTGYAVGYFTGGGFGSNTSGRALGITNYNVPTSTRFHYGGLEIDENPGSTSVTYGVYFGSFSSGNLNGASVGKLVLMEVQQ